MSNHRTAAVFLCWACLGLSSALGQNLWPPTPGNGPPAPASPAAATPPSAGRLGMIVDRPSGGRPGVEVISVLAASPADMAGIRPGDRVLSVNDRAVGSSGDMLAVLASVAEGELARLELQRGDRREVVSVAAGAPPPVDPPVSPAPAPWPSPATGPAAVVRPMLGVTIAPVTPSLRSRLGLAVDRGAVITDIQPGSPADRFGLPLGGVIVSLDGRRIDSPEQLLEAMSAAAPGQEIEVGYYRGLRKYRKRVRLVPVVERLPAQSVVPPPDESRSPAPASEPPQRRETVWRQLGRALGGLVPTAGARSSAPASSSDVAQVAVPAGQLEALQRQVESLQQRVAELERRLGSSPAPGAGP